MRFHGTGTIDNLSAANASLFGVTLNGPLTVGALGSLPTPIRYSLVDWNPSQRFYRLGRWTTQQNGRPIKLTVVSCNNGYNFASGPNSIVNSVVAETTILFHSSNNSDSVPVIGRTSPLPNRCYGWGWAYSLHASRQIGGVYVCPDPLNRSRFEFWVSLSGWSGHSLVEASTTGLWEQTLAIEASLPSTGHVQLQVATASTTLTPSNTYINNPPVLPVFII